MSLGKIGRNEPCPCGSKKKYKQCCMLAENTQAAALPVPSSAQLLQQALSLFMSRQLTAAENLCSDVLRREPRQADAWQMLGMIAGDKGDPAAAIAHTRKAIALNPDNHSYHANLGRLFNLTDQPKEAEACYRKAIALKNDSAYHDNLGNALRAQNKFSEAEASYHRALQLNPNLVSAHRNLADLLQLQERHLDAIRSYQRALALQPDAADIHTNLGRALQGNGQLEDALTCFRHALTLDPNNARTHDNLLYALSYHRPPQEYIAEVRRRGERLTALAQPYVSSHPITRELFRDDPDSNRAAPALRVGLVSADFREHPVGYFLENILAHLNSEQVALFAYPTVALTDALTERVRPYFRTWCPLTHLDNVAAAQKIRADRIHILIDLGGYTSDSRLELFAWRPAPIQVSWLGYWASTGLTEIDYVLADPHSIPLDETTQFCEQPWYLPETRLCFTPPGEDIAVAPLPAATNGYITFGCFNNPTKMNAAVIALWARILKRVPNSQLILKSPQFGFPEVVEQIQARFAAQGIGADRLELQGKSARVEYLQTYNRIDIALDPFPFTGATTSIEGLWMGVPFITRRGDRMIAHQGEGILHNLGLADWIAADDAAYLELAVSYCENLSKLEQLRSELRPRLLASPLCDAPRFARHFEAALSGMWKKYLEGNPR